MIIPKEYNILFWILKGMLENDTFKKACVCVVVIIWANRRWNVLHRNVQSLKFKCLNKSKQIAFFYPTLDHFRSFHAQNFISKYICVMIVALKFKDLWIMIDTLANQIPAISIFVYNLVMTLGTFLKTKINLKIFILYNN